MGEKLLIRKKSVDSEIGFKGTVKGSGKVHAFWYFVIGTIVLIIIGTVYSVLPNPGHPANEIGGNNDAERTFNGTANENFTFPTGLKVQGTVGLNVTNYVYASHFVGDGKKITNRTANFAGITTAKSTGIFAQLPQAGGLRGYQAGNRQCNLEFSGSHICRSDEILQVIESRNISSFDTYPDSWIIKGPPGFTLNANDCMGWTNSSGIIIGAFWRFNSSGGGTGWLTNCVTNLTLACCYT